MRDPQQRRRRCPGRALPLLLALALAACGGGDGGGGGDQAGAGADSAQLAASQGKGGAGGAGDCAEPPILPDSVVNRPWNVLLGWLAQANVTFPNTPDNVAQGLAPLCNNCAPIRLQLQSTAQTYCLTSDSASAQRIAGMIVLLDSFPGAQSLPPIPKGDSIFLFSSGNPGVQHPAKLLYRQNGNTTTFPGTAGWKFIYCTDGHGNTRPASQWRTVADTQATQVTQTAPSGGGGAGDGPGGGTYGWLACANGCCQFYTPPPTGGGGNGPPDTIPPFCVPKNN